MNLDIADEVVGHTEVILLTLLVRKVRVGGEQSLWPNSKALTAFPLTSACLYRR